MRRLLAISIVIIFSLTALWFILPFFRPSSHSLQQSARVFHSPQIRDVHLRSAIVRAEVAATASARVQGLSGRASLASDAGMLFLFPQAELQTFWMKEMHFPLDFLWIRDGLVVGVLENVAPELNTPDTQLRRYQSPEPVNTVLEVNAGWIRTHGVQVGDRATFSSPEGV